MASLTGNQINNTYVGLLKTDNNAAITGQISVTDGTGTSAGFTLNPGNSEFQIDGDGLTNPRLTFDDSRLGNASVFVPINLKDGAGAVRGQLNFDQFSSFNLLAGQIGQFNDPELIVGNVGKAPGTAKIAVQQNSTAGNAYLSANNSDNWFTAYNERITAGSYDGVSENLTLTKPDGSDIVVNIPSGGGGGTAGMVAGTGSFSVKNADFLSQAGFPAVASGADGLALMSNAQATGANSVALGTSAVASGQFGVAISAGSNAFGIGSVGIGHNARGQAQESVAIGEETRSTQGGLRNGSVAIGSWAEVFQQKAVYIGINGAVNTAGGVAIGHSIDINSTGPDTIVIGHNINVPATNNQDTIFMGPNMSISGANYNSFFSGLVGSITNANDSVALGRQFTVNGSGSTAIGRNTNAAGGNSTAIGAFANASAAEATAVGYQAVAANVGWTATKKLELNDYATLNFADDATAAANGVPLGGIYHNAGALRIRIV